MNNKPNTQNSNLVITDALMEAAKRLRDCRKEPPKFPEPTPFIKPIRVGYTIPFKEVKIPLRKSSSPILIPSTEPIEPFSLNLESPLLHPGSPTFRK